MSDVRTAHTADLDAATLEAARALLDDAFDGDFSDHDWEHALGGVHAVVWEDGDLVGHASLVQRRLVHDGRALRAGYVEGVGVRADRRRRGHASAMMEALERVIRQAYDLGALSASADAVELYASRGWKRWRGPNVVAHARRSSPDSGRGRLRLRAPSRRPPGPRRRARLRLARRRSLVAG